MINSGNTLEFLKPNILRMDKYNSSTSTKLLPPSSLTQSKVSGHRNINALETFREEQTPFLLNDKIKDKDRVKVQHLENHTKLQNNNCWNNFRTLYNISASPNVSERHVFQMHQTKDEKDILNVVNGGDCSSAIVTPVTIQNNSAFNLYVNKYHNKNRIGANNDHVEDDQKDSSKVNEANNNCNFYCKQYMDYGLINKKSLTTTMIVMSTEPQQFNTIAPQRTADQNSAYRHIESVHNYAKSKLFENDDEDKVSPNDSRHSSYLDDDDEDDEDNEDEAECNNDDDIEYEDRLPDDFDADYEDIFNKQKYRRLQKLPASSDGCGLLNKSNKKFHFENVSKYNEVQTLKLDSSFAEEVHEDVDVETVELQQSPTNCLVASNGIGDESVTALKPDHHARRPMNAFLIFCKRHRAIVKERYKNLENRAITKILGDWWASLDASDKKCFTNLAQKNKDAFFSANPNFKWYKLPAPPLRSLSTRPLNALAQEYQEDNGINGPDVINNVAHSNNNHSNYFKLADETQMGDLSQLIQDKSKSTKQCVDLQQVLGETSHFLSTHITCDTEGFETNPFKRRFFNENSFSSNSSEDDLELSKKNARSCKGKRYQELVNSGQITTALKKPKFSSRLVSTDGVTNTELNMKCILTNANDFNNLNNNFCQKRSLSESENMTQDLNGFDLEERIKELPALNLDDYLQRKRNTKKKKKFSSNSKKRGQRSSAVNNNSNRCITSTAATDNDNLTVKNAQSSQVPTSPNEPLLHKQTTKQHQPASTAVGSQKRKARKESITRRDVSAIEQEVASLLPLTINGCCYFQEAPTLLKYKKNIEKDSEPSSAPHSLNVRSVSPIIPFEQNSSSSVSVDMSRNTNVCNTILNDNLSSPTSDLLILAEVAANSTELKH